MKYLLLHVNGTKQLCLLNNRRKKQQKKEQQKKRNSMKQCNSVDITDIFHIQCLPIEMKWQFQNHFNVIGLEQFSLLNSFRDQSCFDEYKCISTCACCCSAWYLVGSKSSFQWHIKLIQTYKSNFPLINKDALKLHLYILSE